MNNSKQLTNFCAGRSIWAKAKLSAVFSITNGRVIGLVDVRRRRFCWRFSFVVGAAIYIGGSDNKQQSYRGQHKISLFVGLFARAIMRDGLRPHQRWSLTTSEIVSDHIRDGL